MFAQAKLRQQARIDYQQARGTAHKQLLQAAAKNLQQQQQTQQRTIHTAQAKISQLQTTQSRLLKDAFLDHLVHERLTEIPGIGERRKAEILQKVYKGKLTDLRLAHLLPGIGDQTQAAINKWVNYYQQHLSQELQNLSLEFSHT